MEIVNNKINERYILQVEHVVHDFANWKRVFDSDPGLRQKSGVICYQISQLVGNPNYVMIDLEFESLISLDKFHNVLRKLWTNADGKIIEGPESRAAKLVERKDL